MIWTIRVVKNFLSVKFEQHKERSKVLVSGIFGQVKERRRDDLSKLILQFRCHSSWDSRRKRHYFVLKLQRTKSIQRLQLLSVRKLNVKSNSSSSSKEVNMISLSPLVFVPDHWWSVNRFFNSFLSISINFSSTVWMIDESSSSLKDHFPSTFSFVTSDE